MNTSQCKPQRAALSALHDINRWPTEVFTCDAHAEKPLNKTPKQSSFRSCLKSLLWTGNLPRVLHPPTCGKAQSEHVPYTTVLSEGPLQSAVELCVMLLSDSLGVSGDTSRVLLSMESSRSSRGGGGGAGSAGSGKSLWRESAAPLMWPVASGTPVRPEERTGSERRANQTFCPVFN